MQNLIASLSGLEISRLTDSLTHIHPYTMADPSPATFKPLLAKLVHTPAAFTPADLHRALEHLFTPDAALPEQTGAFLAALHIARVEHRPDMLAAAAASLRARARAVRIDAPDGAVLVDIVGTGGDGHNTFNVSTTAAIVAAGTGAVDVVKVSTPPHIASRRIRICICD